MHTGGGGEHQIAIERRMRGHDGARHAVMGGSGHALGLCLREPGIGRHDGNRRRLPDLQPRLCAGVAPRDRPEPAELIAELPWPGPELGPLAHDIAHGIDRNQRADGDTAIEHQRGGAESALEPSGGRAGSRADSAEREAFARAFQCFAPQGPEGALCPVLRTAVQQVKQDRARHDRHALVAHGKAASLRAQRIRHPGRGIEAEGRSA